MAKQTADTVTVIGAGLMGAALVRALSARGVDVTVWNRSPHRARALVGDRITAAADIDTALRHSDLILACVGEYPHLEAALADRDLSGRTVVNITTGTVSQAQRLDALVRSTGGHYLDGAILCYPADVGTERAALIVAGPRDSYDRVIGRLAALGEVEHISEAPAAANEIDGALIQLFHVPALLAFVDAASVVLEAGMAPDRLRAHTRRMLGNLVNRSDIVIEALVSGGYSTTQAAISTYVTGASAAEAAFREQGRPTALLSAALSRLTAAEAAGWGEYGIAAVALSGRSQPKID